MIYIYVPWYHAQFRSRCIQQSMNQFSNTQQSVTTVVHVELRWSSVSIKLPRILTPHLAKAKCCLSPAAAVCVHWVESAEGVGRTDNSAVGAGLSYLMNTMTARNVRNAYWRNNVANTSSLTLLFLKIYEYLQLVCNCKHVQQSVDGSHSPDAAANCTQCTQKGTMIKIPTYIHTYIITYIHNYIHIYTYILTYMHTYIPTIHISQCNIAIQSAVTLCPYPTIPEK